MIIVMLDNYAHRIQGSVTGFNEMQSDLRNELKQTIHLLNNFKVTADN